MKTIYKKKYNNVFNILDFNNYNTYTYKKKLNINKELFEGSNSFNKNLFNDKNKNLKNDKYVKVILAKFIKNDFILKKINEIKINRILILKNKQKDIITLLKTIKNTKLLNNKQTNLNKQNSKRNYSLSFNLKINQINNTYNYNMQKSTKDFQNFRSHNNFIIFSKEKENNELPEKKYYYDTMKKINNKYRQFYIYHSLSLINDKKNYKNPKKHLLSNKKNSRKKITHSIIKSVKNIIVSKNEKIKPITITEIKDEPVIEIIKNINGVQKKITKINNNIIIKENKIIASPINNFLYGKSNEILVQQSITEKKETEIITSLLNSNLKDKMKTINCNLHKKNYIYSKTSRYPIKEDLFIDEIKITKSDDLKKIKQNNKVNLNMPEEIDIKKLESYKTLISNGKESIVNDHLRNKSSVDDENVDIIKYKINKLNDFIIKLNDSNKNLTYEFINIGISQNSNEKNEKITNGKIEEIEIPLKDNISIQTQKVKQNKLKSIYKNEFINSIFLRDDESKYVGINGDDLYKDISKKLLPNKSKTNINNIKLIDENNNKNNNKNKRKKNIVAIKKSDEIQKIVIRESKNIRRDKKFYKPLSRYNDLCQLNKKNPFMK